MSDFDRIRWQCRRGLLELDLVLERFLRENSERLTSVELERFRRLLAAPDNDLWAWISGRADPSDPALTELVGRLRAVQCVV
jgi:succinate dehydrogenase flavin-adding protein (antitoxin of CptAB toxin-antitoxin module)